MAPIEVTESWDSCDPTGGALHGAKVQNPSVHFFTRRANATNTLNDPQSYSFNEIANHNFQEGETHFQTGYWMWQQVQRSGMIRPINNVKIYGASDIGWANDREGQGRFWRNVFAGSAAVRFHRRPHGLGNSQLAKAHMKSLRLFVDAVDITAMRPPGPAP